MQCWFWINLADWVSKWDEYRNYWVLINALWVRLTFVESRFVSYRLIRHWFRFASRPWLDTDIPSKHFDCLQDVIKTSLGHVFKTSSRHVFKTSSRLLQRINSSSSKSSSRHLQGVFARNLQKVLEDKKLLCWRCVEGVFKTCLEDQQMFSGNSLFYFYLILVYLFFRSNFLFLLYICLLKD